MSTNVLSLLGATKLVGGPLTYSNASIITGGSILGVNVCITGIETDATLDFQVNSDPTTVPSPGFWQLYLDEDSVVGITGLRIHNMNGTGTLLLERVCTGEFKGGACYGGVELGQVAAGDGDTSVLDLGASYKHLSVIKQMVYNDASITRFTEDDLTAPEPAGGLLVAGGVLLIAAAKARGK
jgi:hypothetical protein